MTQTLGIFLPIAVLALISPGPDFVVIVRNALSYPLKAALFTASGICVGIIFHLVINLFGLSLIVQKTPALANIIQIAGGLYLLYLGTQSFLNKRDQSKRNFKANQNNVSSLQGFREGLLTNIFNIKALLFFLALFSQIIKNDTPLFHLHIFVLCFAIINVIYWHGMVLAIQKTIIYRWLFRHQSPIEKTLGVILALLGIQVLISMVM